MRFLLLSLLLPLLAMSAQAQMNPAPPRTLSVSASDTVRVMPDRVIVRFAVVSRGQEADAVRRQNEQAARDALNAVRQAGIPERQIQLRGLRLEEEVEYRNGRRVRIGFIARRDVEVTIDEMDRLPAVVARVSEAGANELGGIDYQLRDRRSAEDEALRRAATRAREKADVLAATLGASIVGVHSVSESGTSVPQPPMPMMAMRMEAADASAGEPEAYAAGEIIIRAAISVAFELD